MPTSTAVPASPSVTNFDLTEHARLRMSQRGIRTADIGEVLRLGRCRHTRGARFFFVGHREVEREAQRGVDIRRLENLQVLLASRVDQVITVYRNPRLPRC